MRSEWRIIVLSIACGVSVWVLDAVVDVIYFYRGVGGFWEIAFTNVPRHELFMRTAALGVFLAFGIITARIVSARRRADEALRRSEEHHRHIVESVRDALLIFDFEGRVVQANPAACRLYGYTAEAFVGLTGRDIVHPDHHHKFRAFQTSARETGSFEAESVDVRSDGSTFEIEVRGSLVNFRGEPHLLAVIQDITDRKRAERRIQHLNSVLRAIRNVNQLIAKEKDVDRLLAGTCRSLMEARDYYHVWIATVEKDGSVKLTSVAGDVERFDELAEQLRVGRLCRCAGEILNGRDLHITTNPERECRGCVIAPQYEGKSAVSLRLASDGRTYGLLTISLPFALALNEEEQELLKEVAGDVGFALWSMEVESDRKRAEQQLREYHDHLEELVEDRTRELELTQQELVEKERLATLGRLIATVSHEIRNPLGTIRTSVYGLGERIRDRGLGVERALDRMERNVLRCDMIIEDLLEFTRKKPPRLEATVLDDYVAEVLEDQPSAVGVTIRHELASGATAAIDRERFRRCLNNLVQNAIQATRESEVAGVVEVATGTVEGWAEIEIRDNGSGIAPDDLERVFEPLFSTRSFGVGLGLSIVKQIVENHGGRIALESELGRGTTATIRLPISSHVKAREA